MANIAHLHQHSPADHVVRLELFALTRSYLAAVDLAATTRAVYETTLEKLTRDLGNDTPVTGITRTQLREHLDDRYGTLAPATYNRNLATIASFFGWLDENEYITHLPTKGLRRKKLRVSIEAERQTRPLPYPELTAVWNDHRKHRLRDRVFWVMAYDTAARADELLGLNIQNIDTANRQAAIVGKGGSAETIYWSSVTARLLPRLIDNRDAGPLFIASRKPRPRNTPAASDLCPTTGKARLSYRRAEEIWKTASGGHTLHQLRHSRLTHLAEAGEDVTMIKAKSRHRSLRSLERYVNPSPTAIKKMTDRHDPNRRHQ